MSADSNTLFPIEDGASEVEDRFDAQSSGQQPPETLPEQVHTELAVGSDSAELKSAESTSTPATVQPTKTTTELLSTTGQLDQILPPYTPSLLILYS